ncbi:MAG: WYL domain-containing protein, partial [Bacteroidaceae bacterium]|nr:WYL domain-containing protein [Bacteroidaceae bacterium]
MTDGSAVGVQSKWFPDKLEKQIVSSLTVSPYAIVYNKQEFYLIGIKDGQEEFYHYRIDRMKNIKQLKDSKVPHKKKKEIQEFALSAVEMFGGDTKRVVAICDNILLDEVVERFGKDISISKVSDSKLKITLDVNILGFK